MKSAIIRENLAELGNYSTRTRNYLRVHNTKIKRYPNNIKISIEMSCIIDEYPNPV